MSAPRVTAWLLGRSMVVEGILQRRAARHGFGMGDPDTLAGRPSFEGAPPVEIVLCGPSLCELEATVQPNAGGHFPLACNKAGLAFRLLEDLEEIGMTARVRETAYPTAAAWYGDGLGTRPDVGLVVVRPEIAGTRCRRAPQFGPRGRSTTVAKEEAIQ